MSLLETKEGREALLWALDDTRDHDDNSFDRRAISQFGFSRKASACVSASNDIHDPAKLAALIAAEARRCGVDTGVFLYGVDHADGGEDVRIWHGYVNGKIQVSVGRSVRSSSSRMLAQSEMRTVLAALLQLPDGAREQAERVLRGEQLEQRNG